MKLELEAIEKRVEAEMDLANKSRSVDGTGASGGGGGGGGSSGRSKGQLRGRRRVKPKGKKPGKSSEVKRE